MLKGLATVPMLPLGALNTSWSTVIVVAGLVVVSIVPPMEFTDNKLPYPVPRLMTPEKVMFPGTAGMAGVPDCPFCP